MKHLAKCLQPKCLLLGLTPKLVISDTIIKPKNTFFFNHKITYMNREHKSTWHKKNPHNVLWTDLAPVISLAAARSPWPIFSNFTLEPYFHKSVVPQLDVGPGQCWFCRRQKILIGDHKVCFSTKAALKLNEKIPLKTQKMMIWTKAKG